MAATANRVIGNSYARDVDEKTQLARDEYARGREERDAVLKEQLLAVVTRKPGISLRAAMTEAAGLRDELTYGKGINKRPSNIAETPLFTGLPVLSDLVSNGLIIQDGEGVRSNLYVAHVRPANQTPVRPTRRASRGEVRLPSQSTRSREDIYSIVDAYVDENREESFGPTTLVQLGLNETEMSLAYAYVYHQQEADVFVRAGPKHVFLMRKSWLEEHSPTAEQILQHISKRRKAQSLAAVLDTKAWLVEYRLERMAQERLLEAIADGEYAPASRREKDHTNKSTETEKKSSQSPDRHV